MVFRDDDGNTVIEISRVDCCFFRLYVTTAHDGNSVTLVMNARLMRDALAQLGFLNGDFHEAYERDTTEH